MSGVTVHIYSEFDSPSFTVDGDAIWVRTRSIDSLTVSMSLSKSHRDIIRKLFDEMDSRDAFIPTPTDHEGGLP